MSNENKKNERSWMNSTAMKLAMLATAITSLSSCGLRDTTTVYGPDGQYMGGVVTTSETNAMKFAVTAGGMALNYLQNRDNNRTAEKIYRTVYAPRRCSVPARRCPKIVVPGARPSRPNYVRPVGNKNCIHRIYNWRSNPVLIGGNCR